MSSLYIISTAHVQSEPPFIQPMASVYTPLKPIFKAYSSNPDRTPSRQYLYYPCLDSTPSSTNVRHLCQLAEVLKHILLGSWVLSIKAHVYVHIQGLLFSIIQVPVFLHYLPGWGVGSVGDAINNAHVDWSIAFHTLKYFPVGACPRPHSI